MGALGDLGSRGGSLVIPKEFERSNLALELKAGKERLELVLHGLTDEQLDYVHEQAREFLARY